MFFDRSLKPGKTKNGQPGGTLVQGLNLYTIKCWGPWGRFYGLGARKTKKTKKLRKPSQVLKPRTVKQFCSSCCGRGLQQSVGVCCEEQDRRLSRTCSP